MNGYIIRLLAVIARIFFFLVVTALLFGVLVWLFRYSCTGWGTEINWLIAIVAASVVGLLMKKYAKRIPVVVCVTASVLICAIVVISLSTSAARSQSVNGLVRQDISNIRSYAEIIYNEQQFSYDGVCDDIRVQSLLESASQHKLTKQVDTCRGLVWVWLTADTSRHLADRTVVTNCRATDQAYKIYSELPELYGPDYQQRYICVDSTGFFQNVDTVSAEALSCEEPYPPLPPDQVGEYIKGNITCVEDGVEVDCDKYFQDQYDKGLIEYQNETELWESY